MNYSPPISRLFRLVCTALPLCALSILAQAQDWQVIDTFEDGESQANWIITSQPIAETSEGYLRTGMKPNTNSTASISTSLPVAFSQGKFTVAFDLYLPRGDNEALEHQVGFGVGSAAQMTKGSWNASGSRNRFQMMGPAPQKLGNAYFWGVPEDPDYGSAKPDALGTTEQGVWYHIWLVYNLDSPDKGVTLHSKKASASLDDGLHSEFFAFDDRGDDDWSVIEAFAISQGLMGTLPPGYESWDVLGALFDNIYVSEGENLTMTPTAIAPEWIEVDAFDDGSPQAEWTVGADITATVENGSLKVVGSSDNAGIYTELPISSIRQSFTVTFDVKLPSGGNGLNHAQFGVVGNDQVALQGAEKFGGSDRFITFGVNTPQQLANFGQWPPTLGPDLLDGAPLDQWHHLWLVYDGTARRVDVYTVPVADPVSSVDLPTAPAGSFALETAYNDLGNLILGTSVAGGNGLVIDNIYQQVGTAITLSPKAGTFDEQDGGLVVGEWNRLDFSWVFGLSSDWGVSTYLGYIYVAALPYIYHADGSWYYLVASNPTTQEHVLYGWDKGWILISEANGGWFYAFTDEIEAGDWAQFPQP